MKQAVNLSKVCLHVASLQRACWLCCNFTQRLWASRHLDLPSNIHLARASWMTAWMSWWRQKSSSNRATQLYWGAKDCLLTSPVHMFSSGNKVKVISAFCTTPESNLSALLGKVPSWWSSVGAMVHLGFVCTAEIKWIKLLFSSRYVCTASNFCPLLKSKWLIEL